MSPNKNIFLYLAIGIPIIMIVVIAICVFSFKVEINPKDNFLYMLSSRSSPYYYCEQEVKWKFYPETKSTRPPPNSTAKSQDCSKVQLYVYDFKQKARTPITLDEALALAKKYKIMVSSSEGFYIWDYCSESNPLWGIGPDYNWKNVCISKKDYRKRLDPKTIFGGTEDERFTFIGWVATENSQ